MKNKPYQKMILKKMNLVKIFKTTLKKTCLKLVLFEYN